MALSNKLKMKRRERGLSIKDVVLLLGERGVYVTDKALYNWESGRRQPDIDTFVMLCDIYDINNIKDEFNAENTLMIVQNNDFSPSEKDIVNKYRSLNDHGRHVVDLLLNAEFERALKRN